MSRYKFLIIKHCNNCGKNEYVFPQNKFLNFLERKKSNKCTFCKSSTKNVTVTTENIEWDTAKILAWALADKEHIFGSGQDEEIVMAEVKYLLVYLQVIQKYAIPLSKRRTLTFVLCIIMYNHLTGHVNGMEIYDDVKYKVLKDHLLSNIDDVLDIEHWRMSENIREVVFPELGIKFNINEYRESLEVACKISDKVSAIKQLDKRFEVFGAGFHNYNLNPTLTELEILKMESKLGVRLPAEYRNFLLLNGNGGVGPNYGLFSIEKSIEWTIRFKESPVSYLSAPFPHKQEWNLWEEDPKTENAFIFHKEEPNLDYLKVFKDNYVGDFVEKDELDKYDNVSSYYLDMNHVRGAIIICGEGCGRVVLLVLSGLERGNIWIDGRESDYGVYPFKGITDDNDKRYTFNEWYNKWFDDILKSLKKNVEGNEIFENN